METIMSPQIAALFSTDVQAEIVQPAWIRVTDRLPEDGELVSVILDRTREIRTAWRGHYQSTGAWFDAKTHGPIYEKIMHWKARK